MTFVELPIRTYDKRAEDLGLKDVGSKDSLLLLRLDQLSEARPNKDEDTGEDVTTIYLTNGNIYSIYMGYENFKKLWIDEVKHINN